MNVTAWLSAGLFLAGTLFYFAGTAGLLRFPDVYTRLHALTKADNVGLGTHLAALVLQADSLTVALRGDGCKPRMSRSRKRPLARDSPAPCCLMRSGDCRQRIKQTPV